MTRRLPGLFIAGALLSACMASGGNAAAARPGEGSDGGCPPEYPGARELAVAFLDPPPENVPDAAALGLSAADTLGLRLLAAPADSAACRQLRMVVSRGNLNRTPYLHSFFKVRGYYMIESVVPADSIAGTNPNGTLYIHTWRFFGAVLDSTYRVVAAYGL